MYKDIIDTSQRKVCTPFWKGSNDFIHHEYYDNQTHTVQENSNFLFWNLAGSI